MKVAAAAEGRVRKEAGHLGLETGSCEHSEGSGLGDFFWLQLHAASLTDKEISLFD